MSLFSDAPGDWQVRHFSDCRAICARPYLRIPRACEGGALKLHRGATFGEVSKAAELPQSMAKPPIPGTGMVLAINNLSLGVGALSAAKPGRGGSRNRSDRESHALKKAHIANLSASEGHARIIGLPFTRMITIHWKAAGVALSGMAAATGKFVDHLTRWLARRGYRIAWLWVHENAGDKCWHCHLLASVPAELVKPLVAAQKRWLRSITGRPYRAKVIRSEPIGGRLGLETGNPELHFANARTALAYICKGAPQSTLDSVGIEREHKAQGLIMGRRCSTSQNIGKAQRKAHHGQKD